MLAVISGHEDVALQLLAAGADPTARNKRRETPLSAADIAGNVRMKSTLKAAR
jgi:ankyrin repeat protein